MSFLTPKRVNDSIPRDAMHPAGRVRRNSAMHPRFHRLDDGELNSIFDQLNAAHTECASQHGNQIGRFVTKKMLDQRTGRRARI